MKNVKRSISRRAGRPFIASLLIQGTVLYSITPRLPMGNLEHGGCDMNAGNQETTFVMTCVSHLPLEQHQTQNSRCAVPLSRYRRRRVPF